MVFKNFNFIRRNGLKFVRNDLISYISNIYRLMTVCSQLDEFNKFSRLNPGDN